MTSHLHDDGDLFTATATRDEYADAEIAPADDTVNIDDPNPALAERSSGVEMSLQVITVGAAALAAIAQEPGSRARHTDTSTNPALEEFWAKQDAKVADELAQARAKDAAEVLTRRCALLRGDDAGFPALAIEHAMVARETKATAHTRKFAGGERRSLVLLGGVGAGKTTAATEYALQHGGSAPGFIRAAELEARGRYADRDSPSSLLRDRDLRAWLRSRSMLVLDDLGAEYMDGKGSFRSLLDELIDLFYGSKKRMIITTNLKIAKTPIDPAKPPPRGTPPEEPQLTERYGARIMSRLFEIGIRGDCGNTDLRRARS